MNGDRRSEGPPDLAEQADVVLVGADQLGPLALRIQIDALGERVGRLSDLDVDVVSDVLRPHAEAEGLPTPAVELYGTPSGVDAGEAKGITFRDVVV